MHRHITLKVILGYLLLTGSLAGATFLVVRLTQSLARFSQAEQEAALRRQATERLVVGFFNVAGSEQSLTAGVPGSRRDYLTALDTAAKALCDLDTLLTAPLQKARLDTLAGLLEHRAIGALQLWNLLQRDNTSEVYREHIENLRSRTDSVIVHNKIPGQSRNEKQTYVVERTSGGFFRRLGNVFRKQRSDTTLIINHTDSLQADTLVQGIDVSDDVAHELLEIRDDIARRTNYHRAAVDAHRDTLRVATAHITDRINRLLSEIGKDESRWLRTAIASEEARRYKDAITMGILAALALLTAFGAVLWIARDISRARRYSCELEEAREKAEQLSRQRERLLLTVAHDVKAPTASIAGYIEMLRNRITKNDEQAFLQNMAASSEHLLHLVSSLLDYHRLEQGRVEIHNVCFSPCRLINEIAVSFRPHAVEKNLRLITETDLPVTEEIWADEGRIRQMTDNLVSNALKFTHEGCIKLKVGLSDNDDGHTLLYIGIKDSGPGLNADEQRRIFEAFTRLPAAQGTEGVGLGLSITRELADLLGGNLKVESRPGEGSTFSLTIPVRRENTDETAEKLFSQTSEKDKEDVSCQNAPKMTAQVKDGQISYAPLHILAIDDDRIALQLLESMITQISGGRWKVAGCNKVEDLFHLLDIHHFDLMFSDIEMPTINGMELLRQIRHRLGQESCLPAVALSANGLLCREDFLRAGFDDSMCKPFTADELRRMVLKMTDRTLETERENVSEENSSNYFHTTRLSALTAFAGDDFEAAAEILTQFEADCREHLLMLQRALEEKDKQQLCRLAHKMLPTFMLIESPVVPQLSSLDARRSEEHWTGADTADGHCIAKELELMLLSFETNDETPDC